MYRTRGGHTLSLWQWTILVMLTSTGSIAPMQVVGRPYLSFVMRWSGNFYWVNRATVRALVRKGILHWVKTGRCWRPTRAGLALANTLTEEEVTSFMQVWGMHDIRHSKKRGTYHLSQNFVGQTLVEVTWEDKVDIL